MDASRKRLPSLSAVFDRRSFPPPVKVLSKINVLGAKRISIRTTTPREAVKFGMILTTGIITQSIIHDAKAYGTTGVVQSVKRGGNCPGLTQTSAMKMMPSATLGVIWLILKLRRRRVIGHHSPQKVTRVWIVTMCSFLSVSFLKKIPTVIVIVKHLDSGDKQKRQLK